MSSIPLIAAAALPAADSPTDVSSKSISASSSKVAKQALQKASSLLSKAKELAKAHKIDYINLGKMLDELDKLKKTAVDLAKDTAMDLGIARWDYGKGKELAVRDLLDKLYMSSLALENIDEVVADGVEFLEKSKDVCAFLVDIGEACSSAVPIVSDLTTTFGVLLKIVRIYQAVMLSETIKTSGTSKEALIRLVCKDGAEELIPENFSDEKLQKLRTTVGSGLVEKIKKADPTDIKYLEEIVNELEKEIDVKANRTSMTLSVQIGFVGLSIILFVLGMLIQLQGLDWVCLSAGACSGTYSIADICGITKKISAYLYDREDKERRELTRKADEDLGKIPYGCKRFAAIRLENVVDFHDHDDDLQEEKKTQLDKGHELPA